MTDRPILFSSPMVRALLDGRKTQTRRVVKPRRHASLFDGSWTDDYVLDPGNQSWRESEYSWRIGDRLWVRESIDKVCTSPEHEVCYMADWPGNDPRGLGWRPSIHMPRWASRLTLVVTGVRVQRIQDIDEADAEAEGVEEVDPWEGVRRFKVYGTGGEDLACPYGARLSFSTLWDSLNEARGFGWDVNPWVVAVTFTVEHRNIDEVA